jgi:hypothetical protein
MTTAPVPRLPLGLSDFRKLRQSGLLYVDKTDFVSQVLTANREVLLVPRPRRFGKTLNLSTVRYFVEKSDEDRSDLFEGLAVWGSAEAREHFRRYPVISLTFKDVKEPEYGAACTKIRDLLRELYKEHAYLLEGGGLKPWEASSFERILRGEGSGDLDTGCLLELSRLLARHHGEKVVILIDEYDTPIHAIRKGEDERRLLTFFRAFLSGGLKDNPHLAKGIVTGILRIAKESLFSGLNNLVVYSLLRPECAASFGFTEAEVKDLAERMGAAAHLPELTSWYNGYRFGGQVIYNPWSVLSFLDSADKVARPYWLATSSDDLLRRIVLTHGIGRSGELETLLSGGEIEKAVDDHVALRDLDYSPESVWSFLLYTGYLKATSVRMDGGYTMATLAIPNREVEHGYRTIVRSWLEHRLGPSEVEDLLRALLAGDAATCEGLLERLLQSFSVHDVSGRRAPKKRGATSVTAVDDDPGAEPALTPEQIYHVFVVSLLLGLQPHFAVRSNRESGGGRYDVMVMPRTPGQPGVVLELKVLKRKRGETHKSVMATALRQIRERDYTAELRALGADPIHEIGIVFDGKQVWVQTAPPPGTPAPRPRPKRSSAPRAARKSAPRAAKKTGVARRAQRGK